MNFSLLYEESDIEVWYSEESNTYMIKHKMFQVATFDQSREVAIRNMDMLLERIKR